MIVNFPQEEGKNDLSLREAMLAYKQISDYHLHFVKQQSGYEFLYWKVSLAFFLAIFFSMFLQIRGAIPDFLIGIVFTGIGFLTLILQSIRNDLYYSRKAKNCAKKCLDLERKYDFQVKIFHLFEEDDKRFYYPSNLLSRLLPICFVSLSTILAGSLLVARVSLLGAVLAAIVLILCLSVMSRLYIKKWKMLANSTREIQA
jgi:hypothetical protein